MTNEALGLPSVLMGTTEKVPVDREEGNAIKGGFYS